MTANQAPPLENWNLAESDPMLLEHLDLQGADWAGKEVHTLGQRIGEPEVIRWGFEANRYEPELATHDRFGERKDEVSYHPAWHALMSLSVEHGLHGTPWRDDRPGAHVARAAMFYLVSQNEAGHGCPISMTHSVIPALRAQPELAEIWEPGLTTRVYDPSFRPAEEKVGLLAGMALTERQGGTDVQANTTTAEPIGQGGPGTEYVINGEKWFCSAPMCDVFLVLAQAPGGLSCFLLPRWLPDGERNGFFIDRLKDKLGNRSNASSEVQFEHAGAWMVGEEGRGVPTIIEMVNHTRLDCIIGSAAIMRQAVTQAAHHVQNRSVFGRVLVEQPLMRNVVADLAIETEAATAAMMRLAGAFDRTGADPAEAAFRRVATPVMKFWVTKRATATIVEALECHGGNGYVEESPLPRLLRESPVNSIWEGSGNVMCLDVLRALRQPACTAAFIDELEAARGEDRRLDAAIDRVSAEMRDHSESADLDARGMTVRAALALQASLLARFSPAALSSAFIATRIANDPPAVFGSSPIDETHLQTLIDRVAPAA